MKFVFRVDASNSIGTGHLMRCLAIADALRERGASIHFICRENPGNLIEMLQQFVMPVTILPALKQTEQKAHSEDYTTWLGTTKDEDARQTIDALHGERPDWLIVDHYAIDAEWERCLRPHVSKVMVIDDLANRPHDCDILLDQNYFKEGELRYKGLVTDECILLIGPRFALLRPEYATYRKISKQRDGEIKRVMVFFGGSDRRNMTTLALQALSVPEFGHLGVDVVVGAYNLHRAEVEKYAALRPQTNLYGHQPNLIEFIMRADVAIGAGGVTVWERMCLGLPSIVIILSNNQIPISKFLAEEGLIRLIGHAETIIAEDIQESLRDEIATRQYVSRSRMGMEICDGTGVSRVIETLLGV